MEKQESSFHGENCLAKLSSKQFRGLLQTFISLQSLSLSTNLFFFFKPIIYRPKKKEQKTNLLQTRNFLFYIAYHKRATKKTGFRKTFSFFQTWPPRPGFLRNSSVFVIFSRISLYSRVHARVRASPGWVNHSPTRFYRFSIRFSLFQ